MALVCLDKEEIAAPIIKGIADRERLFSSRRALLFFFFSPPSLPPSPPIRIVTQPSLERRKKRKKGEKDFRGGYLSRISHPFWHGELVVGQAGQRSIMYARGGRRAVSRHRPYRPLPPCPCAKKRQIKYSLLTFFNDKLGGNSENEDRE